MVGAPGSGKSTWVREQGLQKYCLSPDSIRMMVSSPIMDADGSFSITQEQDGEVWKLYDQILEKRMDGGHFTVLDATHTMQKYLNRYASLCDKYRYRSYIKVFNPPLEELLRRNNQREEYKKVPVDAITKHNERLKHLKIPSRFTVLDGGIEGIFEFVQTQTISSRRLYVVGDIHGCIEPLKEFLSLHYNQDDFYIFLGDYIDRGPDNLGVIQTLMGLSPNNCVFLEGNHEKWLRLWARREIGEIRSKEFLYGTMVDLERCSPEEKKKISDWTRRLRLFIAAEHCGRTIYCTHGGVPRPDFHFIPGFQLIKGVGKYDDHVECANSFMSSSGDSQYMAHGHRNVHKSPLIAERILNLDNEIYEGGTLRVACFSAEGIKGLEFQSNYVHTPAKAPYKLTNPVDQLRTSKDVKEKTFENGISSFNFTRKAFAKRQWNELSCKARGLFIKDNEIVARSYDKFFNLWEMEESSLPYLAANWKYPVLASKKENGFIGILTLFNGEPLYCTKSSIEGSFAQIFREILHVDKENYPLLAGRSLIFEVVHPEKDPHIIEYDESFVSLLDIVENGWEFKPLDRTEVHKIANKFNVVYPTSYALQNWAELYDFIKKAEGEEHEGYVFRDAENRMVKLKTQYYNFWKNMRKLKDRVHTQGFIPSNHGHTAEAISFLAWCQTKNADYIKNSDIITLRKEFHEFCEV